MNAGRPGVKMKPCKLKDAGKAAYPVDRLAVWSGFGAIDDAGRVLEIRVKDAALQHLDPDSRGADHTHVLETPCQRSKILEIAAEKYERGLIGSGNIIWVTDADVAPLISKKGGPKAAPASVCRRTVSLASPCCSKSLS